MDKNLHILLADSDREYLHVLERKFAELSPGTDVMAITERERLAALLAAQAFDFVLLDEAFYEHSLEQHNPILLTGQKNISVVVGQRALYKYTSAKAICEAVLAAPPPVPVEQAAPPSKPQSTAVKVAAIFSPVGGAGCTTVALALAMSLARKGQRVLYIGADSLQNFTFLLGDARLQEGAEKLLARDDQSGSVLAALGPHIRSAGGFDYIPPFRQSLAALGIPGGHFVGLCQSVRQRNAYDTVLLDCSGEYSERTMRLLEYAGLRLILCRQEEHAVRKLRQFLRMFDAAAGETMVVCNRYDRQRENSLLRAPVLAQVQVAAYIEENPEATATLEALRGLERQMEKLTDPLFR